MIESKVTRTRSGAFSSLCAVLASCVMGCGPAQEGATASESGEQPPSDSGRVDGLSVAGTVLDLSGSPVVDVFVTVSTEYCVPDRTDAQGRFEVTRVVPGSKRLVTYGETAAGTPVASVAFEFSSEAAHIFDDPIRLPQMTEGYPIVDQSPTEQVVTSSEGLVLTIPAGALQLAPFAPAEVQVARVPVELVPPIAPEGLELVDVFVLHPILSKIDPPAAVSFPELEGVAPGTRVVFHALDYELGRLVPVAGGAIDEGGVPRTDDGQGVPELTWIGLSLETSHD